MDAASNWTEFRQATSEWWGPTQNMAYADDQGHIGYQAVGLFPIRPAGLSGVPIVETGTAADSEHEWQGYVPFAASCRPCWTRTAVLSPPPTPALLPTTIPTLWLSTGTHPIAMSASGSGFRATPSSHRRICSRCRRIPIPRWTGSWRQRFAYAIDRSTVADAKLRQAADLMRTWDGVITTDSVAAEIVDATKQALWPLVLRA